MTAYGIMGAMKILFYLSMMMIWLPVIAQHSDQPVKESTSDLRSQTTIFKIEDLQSKSIYWLERNGTMDYFLRHTKGSEELIRKIDSREAKRLDRDFASKFLKCQYELPAAQEDCKVTLRLNMKGEHQDICAKEDKKTQEVNTFVQSISHRF